MNILQSFVPGLVAFTRVLRSSAWMVGPDTFRKMLESEWMVNDRPEDVRIRVLSALRALVCHYRREDLASVVEELSGDLVLTDAREDLCLLLAAGVGEGLDAAGVSV